jgi:signal transduction histidine kinase
MAMANGARRDIERDLHDGVQQDLVALAVNLQLAEEVARSDLAALQGRLAEMRQDVHDAIEAVRRIARAVYPPMLTALGLAEALRGAAPGVGIPVRIEATADRYAADIEATVYFCCLDALQGVARVTPTGRAMVRIGRHGESITFEVSVEGIDAARVLGALDSVQIGMNDRVGAVGGTLTVAVGPEGTRISGTIPLGGM